MMKYVFKSVLSLIALSLIATAGFGSCTKGCSFKNEAEEQKKAFEKTAAAPEEKYPEIIQVSDFASSEEIRKTVFKMPLREIARRVGDHKYYYDSKISFTGVRDKHLTIKDRTELVTSDYRDFYLKRETGKGKGLEIWWIGDTLYTGDLGGPYFKRPGEELFAMRFRKSAYKSIVSLLSILGDGIEFVPKGVQDINTLPAYRFGISIRKDMKPAEKKVFPDTPEGKEAESLAAKMENKNTPFGLKHFAKKSKPLEVSGDIWVHDKTGVILKCKLKGKALVGTKFNVELGFDYSSELDNRGEFKPILPPKIEPLPRATKVPTDPLEFYKKTEALPEQREVTGEVEKDSAKKPAAENKPTDAKKEVEKKVEKPTEKKQQETAKETPPAKKIEKKKTVKP